MEYRDLEVLSHNNELTSEREESHVRESVCAIFRVV